MDEAMIQVLIDKSIEAKQFSYSPYSKFPVGAAVVCDDGTVFTGCNVENAAYPLGICAEQTAISGAVSKGYRRFIAIGISSNLKDSICSPCGACRQFMAEFGLDWEVYLIKSDRSYQKMTVNELLPLGFTPQHLTAGKVTNGHKKPLMNGHYIATTQ